VPVVDVAAHTGVGNAALIALMSKWSGSKATAPLLS
jgi:hypothetical protein